MRPHVGHFEHRAGHRFDLESTTPGLRVFNLVVVVHDRTADATGPLADKDVPGSERRNQLI